MEQDRDLVGAVSRLARALRRHPVEKNALGHMGVRVLRILRDHNGIRATELANLMQIRPASMTDAMNRLERDGYIIRKKDPEDSRANLVFLTEKAQMHFQELEGRQQDKNARLLACLTEEETEQFVAICDKLYAALEETPTEYR